MNNEFSVFKIQESTNLSILVNLNSERSLKLNTNLTIFVYLKILIVLSFKSLYKAIVDKPWTINKKFLRQSFYLNL